MALSLSIKSVLKRSVSFWATSCCLKFAFVVGGLPFNPQPNSAVSKLLLLLFGRGLVERDEA